MTLNLDDWHQRFQQQARWTETLRAHIFSRAQSRRGGRILDVGCGTGAVSAPVARGYPSFHVTGLDIDIPRLRFARTADPAGRYLGGDALRLPFPDGVFDLTFCHYLLLWIGEPEKALREMVRVTRPTGWVAALAEPDYGGRIDYPPALAELGRRQTDALGRQGADPETGRKLAGLLAEAGVCVQEGGILGSRIEYSEEPAEMEWKILREDLGEEFPDTTWKHLREADREARTSGRRVLYIPTFYAAGPIRGVPPDRKDA
jgi:SAM-dependent methyltransferase